MGVTVGHLRPLKNDGLFDGSSTEMGCSVRFVSDYASTAIVNSHYIRVQSSDIWCRCALRAGTLHYLLSRHELPIRRLSSRGPCHLPKPLDDTWLGPRPWSSYAYYEFLPPPPLSQWPKRWGRVYAHHIIVHNAINHPIAVPKGWAHPSGATVALYYRETCCFFNQRNSLTCPRTFYDPCHALRALNFDDILKAI